MFDHKNSSTDNIALSLTVPKTLLLHKTNAFYLYLVFVLFFLNQFPVSVFVSSSYETILILFFFSLLTCVYLRQFFFRFHVDIVVCSSTTSFLLKFVSITNWLALQATEFFPWFVANRFCLTETKLQS